MRATYFGVCDLKDKFMDFILSVIIIFPLLGALFGLLVEEKSIKIYGICVTFIELVLTLILWGKFNNATDELKFVEFIPFFPEYGINYFLGIDGISLFLVIICALLFLICMICADFGDKNKHFVLMTLFLQMSIMGVFVSLDALLFVVFWEQSLIPMFYIIGIFGGEKRLFATIKFFIYTFFGSVFMLLGVVAMAYFYKQNYGVLSFNMIEWQTLNLPLNLQIWMFLAFAFGFAIKTPLFPFHTWLPLTYTQAPFLGSMFLAAMMSKMGIYGFLRFCLPMFSAASAYFANFICILALIMIIYASFIAFKKTNAKEIIAYSSAAHMSVIVLGVFSFNQIGLSGAVFMMLSHALISGGLFIGVGFLERKSANLDIFKFGSLSRKMPLFALFFAVMMLGLIGLPLTAGFVGEFLCLAGIYALNPWFALVGGCGIIMSAIYALRMFSAMFSGESSTLQISDIRGGEILALAPIVVLIIVLGVAPNLVLEQINESTQNLVEMMKFNDEALAKEAK